MVVQHNIPAFNANRQLGINNNALSKSLEKLSSGYAINRAGDNAAGLAISEKMRGQISGLTQASANAQDAISLIQTGEGALQETHSILQRMRELSVQSANGTYQDEVDRENIAKEVDALKSELDRISSSTEFNGMKLLDGSISGVETDGRTIGKIDGVTTGSIDKTYGNISKISVSGAKSSQKTATIVGASTGGADEVVVSNKEQKQVAIDATSAGFGIVAGGSTGSGVTSSSVSITFDFGGVNMATAAPGVGAAIGTDATKAMEDYVKNMDNTVIKLDNLNIRFTSQKTGDESSYDESTQTLTIGIRDLASNAKDTSTAALTEQSMDEALVKLVSEKATDSDTLTNSGYSFTTDGQKLQISLKGNLTNDQIANGFHASTYKLEKETGTIDLGAIDAGEIKAGTTFTVDGKTYELTNDASTVKNGNIAVTVGDRGGNTATAAKTIENANGQEIAKALFNAIMAQDDYSDSNNNKSGLVVELDVSAAGTAKITVTNEGERTAGASKVTANGSREEVTNTLKIDQVVQKGTTIQVGDTSVIFDEDTTAADALTKIRTEVIAGLVEKYGASGAGQNLAGNVATDAVVIDAGAKTITFKAMFGERQDVSVTPVENAERQTVTLNPDKIENGSTLSYGGKTYEFVGKEGDKVTTKGNIAVVNNANVAENTYKAILASSKTSGDTTDIKLKGDTLEFATSAKIVTSTAIDESKASKNEKLTFQIGANGTEDQRVSLGIDSMSSSTIGITTKDEETGKVTVEKSIADIDVSTREAANDAIAVIDAAINQVSGTRADLGALQNRLEHTISSLDIANENLTAAESRIRDTDMASEMMKFTKNQIMSQASQSMLAQANTLPQGVLSLLQ